MVSGTIPCACGCGTQIAPIDRWRKRHRFAPGHGFRGQHHSTETRARIATAKCGLHPSDESRDRMSASQRARQYSHSVQTRARISASLHGHPVSAETRTKLSVANHGQGSRENSRWWKGGRRVTSQGYVEILAPDHPRQSYGYVGEHVLVYEAVYGPVPDGSLVHHRNGDKQDNRIENLEMMRRGEHSRWHRLKGD